MSRGSSCSNFNNKNSCSNWYSDNDSGILAKLRRLKIQEGLLLQNVNKIMFKTNDNGEEFMPTSSDLKSITSDLRNSYCEIKNKFDSLKCNTISEEALKSSDIDDIKTDVLELEAKINKFKIFLSSQQTSLKSEEQEIIKNLKSLTEDQGKILKHPKIRAKPFSDIVPSPVKNIINCPFKCQEVQQFQDFLKSYHRNGGWNEYSHNVFVQSWKKHFVLLAEDSNGDIDISDVEKSKGFICEIKEKLPGVNTDDIVGHSEWYLEYLHLKRCQQEALNKWRDKKKIIKKSQLKDQGGKLTEKKSQSIDLIGKKSKQNAKRVNFVVSDEMKRMEEMFSVELLEETSQTSSNSYTGDLFMGELGNTNIEEHPIRMTDIDKSTGQAQEGYLRPEKERGRFHFAKSTQQWTNMCNDRRVLNGNTSMYIPQIDNIKKLCIPKWRLSVKK